MSEAGNERETRAASLPKELVGIDCPKCGHKISQDSEIVYNRDN